MILKIKHKSGYEEIIKDITSFEIVGTTIKYKEVDKNE